MKKVVHLRIYLGREILKRENGQVSNQNQIVSLIYETLEWKNYLKNIKGIGICRIEVEKVLEHDGENFVVLEEIPQSIKDEVKAAHSLVEKPDLTPEQKEIAELKAQMAELLKANKVDKTPVNAVVKVDEDELAKLQAKYEAKFNKKPHHMMGIKKLKEELTK